MIKILRVGEPPGGTNTVLANPSVLLDVPAPAAEVRVTTPFPLPQVRQIVAAAHSGSTPRTSRCYETRRRFE